jgi:hypothetical protein
MQESAAASATVVAALAAASALRQDRLVRGAARRQQREVLSESGAAGRVQASPAVVELNRRAHALLDAHGLYVLNTTFLQQLSLLRTAREGASAGRRRTTDDDDERSACLSRAQTGETPTPRCRQRSSASRNDVKRIRRKFLRYRRFLSSLLR